MEKRQIRIEFEDTGPGIPVEIRDRIFDPFFTTRGQGEGTGLGLAVCHGVLESHGGTIEVGGEPGRGALFAVNLPIAADLVTPPAPAVAPSRPQEAYESGSPRRERPAWPVMPPPEPKPVSPLSEVDLASPSAPAEPAPAPAILIVDDDVDLREILRETFQGRGYRALGAANGTEAQALFQGSKIDAVLMDIRMPREDGIEILRKIRAHDPRVPVILITGMVTEEELQEANALGIRACLYKPFELKRLLTEIDEVFGSRSAA